MSRNKLHLISYILIGIFLGVITSIVPNLIFALGLYSLVASLIWRFSNPKDRKFLLMLFILGLGIRFILGIALHSSLIVIGRSQGALFNDDGGWPRFGQNVAQFYKGEVDSIYDPWGERNLFVDFLGLQYFIFGYSTFLSKLANILLGAITGVLIFRIAKLAFNTKVAKLASLMYMLWPSLILWSILNLKDTFIIFLIASAILSSILFFKQYRVRYPFFFLLSMAGLFSVRRIITIFIFSALVISFFFSVKMRLWRKVVIVLFIYIIAQFTVTPIIDKAIFSQFAGFGLGPNILLSVNRGFVSTGGAIYKAFDDIFYQDRSLTISYFSLPFIKALGKGFLYFMFSPFFWQIRSANLIAYFPLASIWLLLAPFTFMGVLIGLRYAWKKNILVLFYLMLGTYAYALSSGNIGTAARHRDMFIPFYLIYTSVGLIRFFSKGRILEVEG